MSDEMSRVEAEAPPDEVTLWRAQAVTEGRTLSSWLRLAANAALLAPEKLATVEPLREQIREIVREEIEQARPTGETPPSVPGIPRPTRPTVSTTPRF